MERWRGDKMARCDVLGQAEAARAFDDLFESNQPATGLLAG
jgi:hypothetical protein